MTMVDKSSFSVDSYEFFSLRVACVELQAARSFSLETKVYTYLKRQFNENGYKFIRVDTTNQIGFPDCVCLKGSEYVLVEAKMLKTTTLTRLTTNVEWQAGQIPFMLKALLTKMNYLLIIAKDNRLFVIGDEKYVWTMLDNTNNFGCLRICN